MCNISPHALQNYDFQKALTSSKLVPECLWKNFKWFAKYTTTFVPKFFSAAPLGPAETHLPPCQLLVTTQLGRGAPTWPRSLICFQLTSSQLHLPYVSRPVSQWAATLLATGVAIIQRPVPWSNLSLVSACSALAGSDRAWSWKGATCQLEGTFRYVELHVGTCECVWVGADCQRWGTTCLLVSVDSLQSFNCFLRQFTTAQTSRQCSEG